MMPASPVKFAICFAFLPLAAQAADLMAYRALYDSEPVRIDQGTTSAPIDGQIGYEMTGSDCAGWQVKTRLGMRFAQAEAGLRVVDLQSTTFESADGLAMTASQKETVNGEVSDDEQIQVGRPSSGVEANGTMSGSKGGAFKLGAETLFPTQHQKKLLAAAEAGDTRDVSYVYDASDGAKQYRIVTFIGKRRAPGSFTPDAARPELASLSKLASWSFQLGYYPLTEPDAETPDFQATFNMYENGVSTEMLFDYGSYAMKARLKTFEPQPATPCDAAKPLAVP